MVGWLFLSFGLTLGMLWAYEELGWGGFWGWDPVENAGALPWFTATAFLHSVMVQERRGMLRVWNVTLVITTFFLTIFGTFMTRSGIVQSVHAFGEDRALATLFTIFMVVVLTSSFGLVIYRLPLLKSRNDLDSWISREAAFLANNWVLLFSAFFILFATMFPTLSEAVRGERLTVGPHFYNKWMTPIGLILLVLTGTGPLLAWRKSTFSNLVHQFLWPTVLTVVTVVAVVFAGVPLWASGLCFGLCGFVIGTIGQEFFRGAAVRKGATGTDIITAMIGLIGRSRRRYGGYIVHVGIVLMFLGFAGQEFKREETVLLKPGQVTKIGRYTVTHDALRVTNDAQKQMITGHVSIAKNGAALGTMEPAKWFFSKHEEEPTTEVAIRRAPAEDLYVVLGGYNVADQSATYAITINPLVNWIWLGFAVMAIGTGLALMPESAFAFAVAKLPATATTSAMILLLLLPVSLGAQAAQTVQGGTVQATPKSALEAELEGNIICTCGCRRPLDRGGMPKCEGEASQRAKIREYIAQGKDHDGVIAAFIHDFGGQDILSAPVDKGFNRLAWLFPYLVGITGAAAIGFAAIRWSRHHDTQLAVPGMSIDDPALKARLDDELRDLD